MEAEKVEQTETELQLQGFNMLLGLPTGTAIGIACSFLLHCAYNYRVEFRRVMNEKVVREGYTGISLLQLFNRVAR